MLSNQITAAHSSDYPFSYFWGTEFFDEVSYSNLVASLPTAEQYEEFYHADAVTEYGSTRHRFMLTDENIARLSPAQQQAWGPLVDSLMSKDFRAAVFNKLSVDLTKRFGTLKIRCSPKVLLYRDISGYKITPHADHHTKVVTTQFYLPSDSSIEDVGTELYVKKTDLPSKDFNDFSVHQKMKFLPRHGYGFAVNDNSWHGVSMVNRPGIVRNSLMAIYYLDGKK